MTRPSIANPLSDLNRRRDADLRSRRTATTILTPEAIGAKASAAGLLTTTLGGIRRAITNEDLAAFARSAKMLGAKLGAGITAQEVIDRSEERRVGKECRL